MPPPVGLINLSTGELIAAAGGDPWKINDELQAGDAGAINAQADAFHSAAGSATEVEDDFTSAKQRFEQGWRHNGVEHPITESAEVTRATMTLHLQQPQLAKIALDLETVAAALATAQRAIGAAKAAKQDTQGLHDAAVATVRITLGEVQGVRNGYVATMTSAESAMAAAGAVAGGTADGVRQATLGLIDESPGTGPGKADPGLLKWLEDPKIGGVELKGFSRVAGVVAAASAVPAVMSDIHDGNSVAEAVTRESAGVAVGLWAGAGSGATIGALAGSVVPGAGTAVGLVVGAVVGGGAALLTSKGVEMAWDPVANAVGSAVDGVESVFGFG